MPVNRDGLLFWAHVPPIRGIMPQLAYCVLLTVLLGSVAGCGGRGDSPGQVDSGANDAETTDDIDDNGAPAEDPNGIVAKLRRIEAELNRESHLHSICHEATELVEQALREDPDLAVAYAVRADVHTLHGEKDEALRDYKKAFKLDRDIVVYGQKLAVSYEADGQLDEALDVWKELCRRFPNEWRNFFGRGSIYDMQGKEDKAQADYERANRLQQRR